MGQMTLGLLWGVEAPDLPSAEDYDEPLSDLLARFHTQAGIDTYPSGAQAQPCVTQNHDGNRSLVGIWVAVGGSGDPVAPSLLDEAVPLDTLAQVYGKALTTAQALWTEFARYCTEREHLTLLPPTLWITPTEVA